MKQLNITRIILTLLFSMAGITTYAHDIELKNEDGVTIYYVYVWNIDDMGVAVSYRGDSYSSYANEYSGNVVIPDYVIYDGMIYYVTRIDDNAFNGCTGLKSVTIPSSVMDLGYRIFRDCI